MTSPSTVTTPRGKEQTFAETLVRNVEVREGVRRSARIGRFGVILGFLAVVGLSLSAASLVVIGGAILALLLFFPLFLLGLVGVLAGLDDHTVQQHNPTMDGTRWRK